MEKITIGQAHGLHDAEILQPLLDSVSTPFKALVLHYRDQSGSNRTALDFGRIGPHVKDITITEVLQDEGWTIDWDKFKPGFALLEVIENLSHPIDRYSILYSILQVIPNATLTRFSFDSSISSSSESPYAEIDRIIALP